MILNFDIYKTLIHFYDMNSDNLTPIGFTNTKSNLIKVILKQSGELSSI